MPNALDLKDERFDKILMEGNIGTGKTTQFLTLPGKKFIYLFDPSGRKAIKGYDVTYEEFLAEKLNITVKSLPKGGKLSEIAGTKIEGESRLKAFAYAQWEAHFMESLDNGFFDQFDAIGLDSITSLADIAMDDILAREGLLGYPPALNHHNILKTQMARILRVLCAMDKIIFVTGHTIYRQNEATLKSVNELLITGDLQVRGPLLFSSVLRTSYEALANGKKKFIVQTIMDKYNENLKSDIPGIAHFQDVTIHDMKNPEKYGIGFLIKMGG